jgi:uncharacterized FlaG/YvyC family protein
MTSANTIHTDLQSDELLAARRPGHRESGNPVGRRHEDASLSQSHGTHLPDDPLSPEISQSLAALNEMLNSSNQQLSISVDPASGAVSFRIVDTTTGDVVLQVPSAPKAGISNALIIRRGVLLDTNQ